MRSKNSLFPAAKRHAYSLVELLVVMSIVLILAALVIGTSGTIWGLSGTKVAENQIGTLTSLLETYKIDNGTYPTELNGASATATAVLLEAFFPTDPTAKRYPLPVKWLDSYRAGAPEAEIRRTATCLVDAFGNPLHYQYTGAPNRNGQSSFDLWSQGHRNSPDEHLWVKNW